MNLPLASNLAGKVSGGLTFTRASGQWYQDDSGTWQYVASGVPAVNSKGLLTEPASTNKCTCYGAIPADAYGATRTSGYVLAKGVKYEIVSRSVLDFTTVGSADNVAGTQFVATGGTLGAGDSVKDVLFGVGTKSYYVSGAWAQNHTNMTASGDTAGILSTVFDTAVLTATGLLNLCPSGKVYKLDNSIGVTQAKVIIGGTTGNTNTHSPFFFGRVSSGSGTLRMNAVDQMTFSGANYTQIKKDSIVPSDTSQNLTVAANPGSVVYFVLPDLEELPFCTSPMPTAGATATRAAATASLPTAENLPLAHTGYVEWTPQMTSNTARWLLGTYQDANNYFGILRDGTAGTVVVRKRVGGVNYDATYAISVTVGVMYKIAWRVGPAGVDVFVNGVKGTGSSNTTPPVFGATVQLGADGNGGNMGRPQLRAFRIYRKPLSDAQCIAKTS